MSAWPISCPVANISPSSAIQHPDLNGPTWLRTVLQSSAMPKPPSDTHPIAVFARLSWCLQSYSSHDNKVYRCETQTKGINETRTVTFGHCFDTRSSAFRVHGLQTLQLMAGKSYLCMMHCAQHAMLLGDRLHLLTFVSSDEIIKCKCLV